MNSGHQVALIPLNDCVLVELKQSYTNLNIKEGKYDTRTEGIVVATSGKTIYGDAAVDLILGKRVFFEQFKEGSRIKRDGKLYSFIKIADIRGYENVETSD